MKFKTHKISFCIVRHFAIGFTIYSPTLNRICFEINLGCFMIRVWSKGEGLIGFKNYWIKQS